MYEQDMNAKLVRLSFDAFNSDLLRFGFLLGRQTPALGT